MTSQEPPKIVQIHMRHPVYCDPIILMELEKSHYSGILEEFDKNKDQKSKWLHLLSFSSLRDWLQGT